MSLPITLVTGAQPQVPPAAPAVSGLLGRGPGPRAAFRAVLAREDAAAFDREAPRAAPVGRAPGNGLPVAGSLSSMTAGHSRAPMSACALAADDDPLDPLHRHRAALAPPDTSGFVLPVVPPLPGLTTVRPVASETARALPSLEDLIPALVRKVAWSGDGRRGTARLEIGAGELSGATLLVHADEGHVRVHLDVPSGVDARVWQKRIAERLASRSIPTDAVDVT